MVKFTKTQYKVLASLINGHTDQEFKEQMADWLAYGLSMQDSRLDSKKFYLDAIGKPE